MKWCFEECRHLLFGRWNRDHNESFRRLHKFHPATLSLYHYLATRPTKHGTTIRDLCGAPRQFPTAVVTLKAVLSFLANCLQRGGIQTAKGASKFTAYDENLMQIKLPQTPWDDIRWPKPQVNTEQWPHVVDLQNVLNNNDDHLICNLIIANQKDIPLSLLDQTNIVNSFVEDTLHDQGYRDNNKT